MSYDPRYGAPQGSPQQAQQAQQVPLSARQAPWPAPEGAMPPLNQPTYQQFATTGAPWRQLDANRPVIQLPYGPNIAITPRYRTLTFTDLTANQARNANLQFDTPVTVFQLTAAARLAGGGALAAPLDQFLVNLERTTGDRLTTEPALGSCIFGTAQRPAMIGPNGWMLDMGASIRVTVTSLVADLQVYLTFWCAEVRGPATFTWTNG